MKWQFLLMLLALAAVAFAITGEDVRAETVPYSFEEEVDAEDAETDADLDEEHMSFVETGAARVPKDPFVAKHYKKGFAIGRFGRPILDEGGAAPPASYVTAKLVEDCMTCRMVWQQVQSDVGNTELQRLIYDSFIQHCREGLQTPIQYNGCQSMFQSIEQMVTSYATGFTVNDICVQAKMCR